MASAIDSAIGSGSADGSASFGIRFFTGMALPISSANLRLSLTDLPISSNAARSLGALERIPRLSFSFSAFAITKHRSISASEDRTLILDLI